MDGLSPPLRALALAGGLGVAAGAGELAYDPEPGTEVARRWSETLRLEVDALDETLGGQPMDLPLGVIELEQRRALAVDDVLVASADGRPAELVRAFAEAGLELAVRLDDRPVGRVTGSARAADAEVRFVREPGAERFARERLAGDVAGLLEALDPDLDLAGLLPDEPVEEGAEWEPDPEVLRAFFAAGGDVGFRAAELVIEMPGAPVEVLLAASLASLHALFGPDAEVSGEVRARHAGAEEAAGDAALARIELDVELRSEVDLGARFRAYFEGASDFTHACELSGEVEGELVLLWDLDARHLRSARFAGDVSLAGRAAFPVRPTGATESVDFTGEYELSGAAEVELVVE